MYVRRYVNECMHLCAPVGRCAVLQLSGKYKNTVLSAERHLTLIGGVRGLGTLVKASIWKGTPDLHGGWPMGT